MEVWPLVTFTSSYRARATVEPGRATAIAEEQKKKRHCDQPLSHWLGPISKEGWGGA